MTEWIFNLPRHLSVFYIVCVFFAILPNLWKPWDDLCDVMTGHHAAIHSRGMYVICYFYLPLFNILQPMSCYYSLHREQTAFFFCSGASYHNFLESLNDTIGNLVQTFNAISPCYGLQGNSSKTFSLHFKMSVLIVLHKIL